MVTKAIKNDVVELSDKDAMAICEEQIQAKRDRFNKTLAEQRKRIMAELKDPKSPKKRILVLKIQMGLNKEKAQSLYEVNKGLRAEIKSLRSKRVVKKVA